MNLRIEEVRRQAENAGRVMKKKRNQENRGA